MQHTIKQQFRGLPDEFVTSQLAAQAKVRKSGNHESIQQVSIHN